MSKTIPVTDLQKQLEAAGYKDVANYWRERAAQFWQADDLAAAIFAHQQAQRNESYIKEQQ